MKIMYVAAMLAALALTPQLSAQQTSPQQGAPPNRKMMQARMDSLDHRLDSLVARMNQATGEQKVTAMSAVINEMVSQRHAMRRHMRHMMDSGAMKHQGDSTGAPGNHHP